MTSGPLDRPRPQLTVVAPLSGGSGSIADAQARPPAAESRERGRPSGSCRHAGTLADRTVGARLLVLGLTDRLPWSWGGNGLGSRPENRAWSTDADPRSVCLLDGPSPLVGSPNTTRAHRS
jgi:hypothetical protein